MYYVSHINLQAKTQLVVVVFCVFIIIAKLLKLKQDELVLFPADPTTPTQPPGKFFLSSS